MALSKRVAVLLMSLCVLGCQGSIGSQIVAYSFPVEPRNYKSAGFDNKDHIKEYLNDYLYFASKISLNDWDNFYRTFPEYWIDIQRCKQYTFFGDYNPGYTAYAFRWITLMKKRTWDENTIKRLENGKLSEGDDIFKVIYSKGVQKRLIWDNDFEILVYDDKAIMFENGVYIRTVNCDKCGEEVPPELRKTEDMIASKRQFVLSDESVLKILPFKRPTY